MAISVELLFTVRILFLGSVGGFSQKCESNTILFIRFGFAGGDNESSIRKTSEEDIEVIRRRENKWLHMLDHWDKYMLEKYKKVRHRCRKGIPPSIRPRAWQHLCGAKYRMSRQILVKVVLFHLNGCGTLHLEP